MRVSATHSTVYRYDLPVYLAPHIVRLRPRTDSAQKLLAFDLQITPTPAGTTECLDQDGNLALKVWFNAPTRELGVTSRFTVELLRENPFDYLLIDEPLSLPLWYREPLCAALAPYRKDAHVAESVKQYAKSVAAGAQWNVLQFLTALSRQISQTFRADDPPRRPRLAVRANPRPDGGILPRFGGPFLRRLPRDGNRGPLRQWIRMRFCGQAGFVHARLGRSVFTSHRMAGVRPCSGTRGVQHTRRCGRWFRSRARLSSGRAVHGRITVDNGGCPEPACRRCLPGE